MAKRPFTGNGSTDLRVGTILVPFTNNRYRDRQEDLHTGTLTERDKRQKQQRQMSFNYSTAVTSPSHQATNLNRQQTRTTICFTWHFVEHLHNTYKAYMEEEVP